MTPPHLHPLILFKTVMCHSDCSNPIILNWCASNAGVYRLFYNSSSSWVFCFYLKCYNVMLFPDWFQTCNSFVMNELKYHSFVNYLIHWIMQEHALRHGYLKYCSSPKTEISVCLTLGGINNIVRQWFSRLVTELHEMKPLPYLFWEQQNCCFWFESQQRFKFLYVPHTKESFGFSPVQSYTNAIVIAGFL